MAPMLESVTNLLGRRSLIVIVIAIAVVLFLVTWFSIRESRSDSFRLLELQGAAFTEALAQSSENAMSAETFYDRLTQRHYSDLVATLLSGDTARPTLTRLAAFAQAHDLDAVYLYKSDSTELIGCADDGAPKAAPKFVENEVKGLFANPENRFVLLMDEDARTGAKTQYYLEITNRLDRIVVFAVDARTYADALDETGIGALAQRMAGEPGVEYILYQSTKGIVFASREISNILSIESDPFLKSALDADTIMSRIYTFQGKRVLELVRPFSSKNYPFGLFRVGLSLSGYYSISRGYDRQMIVLSLILFTLVVVALLYINSRRSRQEISRQYSDIKTVTDRIFEQVRVGVAAVEDTGIIRLANNSFTTTLGLSAPVGRKWSDIVTLPALSLDDFLRSGKASDETEITANFAGPEKTLLVARSKIAYEDSDRGAVVVVLYDVTRFRQYQHEAARKQRLSEMGNLAAGVAHEIRNPLNTISIAAQRLASEFTPKENSDEYREFTQKIKAETKRLNDIITRFLSLTREEKSRNKRLSVSAVVDDFVSLARAEADKLGIDIRVSVTPGLQIEGDPDELRQAFLNLYNNSKESLAGKSGVVRIDALLRANRAIITFSDNGPGIPAEIRQNIFTPYFTTKDSGTGIGLSTVYRIITDMNGEIKLNDSASGGASFEISLPIAHQPHTA